MVYLYKDYDSAIKKNEIMLSAAIPMDLDIIILSEISQRQIPYDIIYTQNLKPNKQNQNNKQKPSSWVQRIHWWLLEAGVGGGG